MLAVLWCEEASRDLLPANAAAVGDAARELDQASAAAHAAALASGFPLASGHAGVKRRKRATLAARLGTE